MRKNYLVNGPISQYVITSVLERMSEKTDMGGHTIFLGQVRADKRDGKIVKAIEYSAYEGMVETEADKIRKSVLEEYDDVRSIEIVHSTGIVKAGEISLLVTVSAGHRKQAMEACTMTVELIKQRLPVWKKEVYEDNSHDWR
jgi:molybdopterin synthase catalytic subunit